MNLTSFLSCPGSRITGESVIRTREKYKPRHNRRHSFPPVAIRRNRYQRQTPEKSVMFGGALRPAGGLGQERNKGVWDEIPRQ